jgi:hypothetical protein
MTGVQIGRVVHFVHRKHSPGQPSSLEHVAGIVVRVHSPDTGLVNLQCFHPNDSGTFFVSSARHAPSEADEPNTWHWPEREEDAAPVLVGKEGEQAGARQAENRV